MDEKLLELRQKVISDGNFRTKLATDTLEALRMNGLEVDQSNVVNLDLDFDLEDITNEQLEKGCILVKTVVICKFKTIDDLQRDISTGI
nr:hypothetical protein [uncultured Allomuricauda sp.]